MTSEPKNSANTQTRRRWKYGLNVAVSIIAVLLLVDLVNWFGYQYFTRFDLTATGRHSLSDQTRKVLRSLDEPYTVTTLLTDPDSLNNPQLAAAVDQTRDLIDEYARFGRSLNVEHVNPSRDLAKMDVFYAGVIDRYKEQLEPLSAKTKAGRDAIKLLGKTIGEQAPTVGKALDDPSFKAGQFRRSMEEASRWMQLLNTQIEQLDSQLQMLVDQPLPDYSSCLNELNSNIARIDENISRLVSVFHLGVDDPSLSDSVKDAMLGLIERFERLRQTTRDAMQAIRQAEPATEYDQLRTVVMTSAKQMVVVTGPQQMRVIPLQDMFRAPDRGRQNPNEPAEAGFVGEEVLTGVLVSMSMTNPPMVVFVGTGQGALIDRNGPYTHVAGRLRTINFDVRSWNPTPQTMPTGSLIPGEKPPEPAPGQKVIWVLLPAEQITMQNITDSHYRDQTVAKVKERLDAGDAVMMFVQVSNNTMFERVDPIVEVLSDWDITPQLDRLILREVPLRDGRTNATSLIVKTDWSTVSPITQALGALPGVFVRSSPLVIGRGVDKGIQLTKLVEVQGPRVWAEREFAAQKELKLKPGDPTGPFTVAVAAEKDDTRLIVISDPLFANDFVTTNADPMLNPAYARQMLPAVYPANAEMFVNCVYWLAKHEQLIAASARSQDLRRIGTMSPSTLTTLQWLLIGGLPAGILVTGVVVWLVRRRG